MGVNCASCGEVFAKSSAIWELRFKRERVLIKLVTRRRYEYKILRDLKYVEKPNYLLNRNNYKT